MLKIKHYNFPFKLFEFKGFIKHFHYGKEKKILYQSN